MSPANPVPSAIRVSVTRTGSQTPRASPWRPPQALPGGPHSRRDKPQTTVGPAAPRGPPRSPSFLPGRGVLRPRGIRQEHVPNGWPWQATRAGSERHRGSCCGPDGGLKGGQSHPGWASHGPRGQKERGIQALERARSPVSPARRRGGCWSGSPRPPSSSLHSSPRLCRPWPPPLTPPPGSGSEPKQRCTPTQDTVCGCKPGTEPQDGFKRGVGEPGGGGGQRVHERAGSACPRGVLGADKEARRPHHLLSLATVPPSPTGQTEFLSPNTQARPRKTGGPGRGQWAECGPGGGSGGCGGGAPSPAGLAPSSSRVQVPEAAVRRPSCCLCCRLCPVPTGALLPGGRPGLQALDQVSGLGGPCPLAPRDSWPPHAARRLSPGPTWVPGWGEECMPLSQALGDRESRIHSRGLHGGQEESRVGSTA